MGVPSFIEDEIYKAVRDRQAIQRVRELAEKFEQEPQDEMVNYHLIARRIFTSIKDGEQ